MRGIRELLARIVKDVKTIYPLNVVNRAKKPSYPFSTYNVLNLKTGVTEQGIRATQEGTETTAQQPQLILSVNSYSDDDIEAMEQARKVYHYFQWNNHLEDIGVVVVKVGDIQNRTILITDHYEYRYGFDVWIRYLDTIERQVGNIEEWRVSLEND